MNWEKFKEFSANHLELAPCLLEHLQPNAGDHTMKQVVEQQLDYIAVRPWEVLNLGWAAGHRLISGGDANVTITVYAHIEGEETPCARGRTIYSRDDGTIQDLIRHLKEWHGEYWAQQNDCPIVFDAIVLKTSLDPHGAVEFRDHKKALAFFLFPPGFTA